jgi:hypothetical protein
MNWKPFLAFLAGLLVFSGALGGLLAVRRPPSVTFVFTGDTQGFLVPCGCRTVPAGGLARRAGLLAHLRGLTYLGPVVPVEVAHGLAERGPAREILNRQMGRFFKREGVLLGLGGYDLLSGPEALHIFVPGVEKYLSGRKAYKGSREFRLGGWGVGPLGAPAARLRLVFVSETPPEGTPMADPVEAFEAETGAHPADGYVVTGNLSTGAVGRLLKAHPEIVAVVAQWGSQVTTTPQRVEGTWVLWIGDRGRRAATLTVLREKGRWSALPGISYLGPEVPSDPEVEAEVEHTLARVEAENRRALEFITRPAPAGEGYVGAASCAPCHAGAHEIWRKSRHTRATEDLAVDHQTLNPECLKCHATGVGKPGGYPRSDADLGGVQCEACHGPGAGHPPRKLAVPPVDASCAPCHGKRDSPLFAADAYWQVIRHGRE